MRHSEERRQVEPKDTLDRLPVPEGANAPTTYTAQRLASLRREFSLEL